MKNKKNLMQAQQTNDYRKVHYSDMKGSLINVKNNAN